MNYHFLFDYDGVLVHKVDFAQSLADRHGIDPEKIREFFQTYLQKCLRGEADMIALLEKHLSEYKWDKSATDLFKALYLENNQYNSALIDFIRDKLTNPFVCYIATNQDRHRYRAIASESISTELFKEVFSSSELEVAKPDISYFEKIYSSLLLQNPSLTKEEVVFIDDLQENVDSAALFGFNAHIYVNQEGFERFVEDLMA